jgi:hypothetical protein
MIWFSDLNDFVKYKVFISVQKWQSRKVTGTAWNDTEQVLEAFNSSLKHTVLKTTDTIGDLGRSSN